MSNRFVGAWYLRTFETRQADGQTVYPLGERPRGMFSFAGSGHFSVQLGPEVHEEGRYTAFYGTYTVAGGDSPDSGVLTLNLETGSNPERISGEQVRRFHFVNEDTVRLQPPATPDGSQSTITWRRAR